MGEADHPANWYADPWTPGRLRYWNGQTWTPHVCIPVPSGFENPTDLQSTALAVGEPLSPELAASETETALGAAADELWRDLGANRPGQLVRGQAEELRRAAPFRTMLARLAHVHTDERAFRIGAKGEEIVGRRLDRLGPAWHVLHSVYVGNNDADIDHVVIGPGGVFTINTKHHPGGRAWVGTWAIMINGQKVPYLRSSRFEATRAADLLSAACGFPVKVQAAIVIITTRFALKQQPEGVFVGGPRSVARWIEKRPLVLAPDKVADIYEHARRDTTWRPARARSSKRVIS
ncbi:MAG: NERD domain-containing protein [Actinomycetota bacterium]|nr:NERD domain-containing protein [Actinomycetota bacterium]